MDIFPVQYSTLSAPALKDRLQDRYGFNNASCRLLVHNVSDTYILETESSKYIFKIYRGNHRSLEELRAEVELLNILREKGAKVSSPIPDLEGGQIQSFNAPEGIRHGILFSFATGKVVRDMNETQLRTVGDEMALIHNITSDITLHHDRKEYNIETTITRPLERIKAAFKELPEEYQYLEETAIAVISKLATLDDKTFGYGYCHYDFFPKNFHFDDTDSVTFFDFDFAGKGYLINDIVSFYLHFFLEVTYHKMDKMEAQKAFGIFVESYRKIRPLPDEELQVMRYFGFAFWVFYLGFQHDNFDDWSNIFFTTGFIKDRVGLIKKWMEWDSSWVAE